MARIGHPLLLVLLALVAGPADAEPRMPRVLVLTGSGPSLDHGQQYPPWVHEFQNEEVAAILAGSAQVDITDDLAVLDASRLARYDLVISNSLFLTPSQAQLQALRDFVTGGKALMTLHCGLLSFLNAGYYEEMIGGIFIGGPSEDPETFEVVTGNPQQLLAMVRFQSCFRWLQADLPLPEVALASGYYDQAHFNREFRRHAGMTPGEWKRAQAPLNRFFVDASSRAYLCSYPAAAQARRG